MQFARQIVKEIISHAICVLNQKIKLAFIYPISELTRASTLFLISISKKLNVTQVNSAHGQIYH